MSGISLPESQARRRLTAPDFRHVRALGFRPGQHAVSRRQRRLRAHRRAHDRICRRLSGHGPPMRPAALQKTLYREHGTTLNGLIKLHGMDPEPYLDFVHRDRPVATCMPMPALALPSNGCPAAAMSSPMAAPIMRRAFWSGWACPSVRRRSGTSAPSASRPSPIHPPIDRVLAHGGFAPRAAAMFDDIARNLVAAHALGMTTVWLNSGGAGTGRGRNFRLLRPRISTMKPRTSPNS